MTSLKCPPGCEATAASVVRIVDAKDLSARPDLYRKVSSSASRAVYRLINRLKLKWDVPISEVLFETDVGMDLVIPYIKPTDALTYIVRNCPEIVLGGFTSWTEGSSLLRGYWEVYKNQHPAHRVFEQFGDSLERCIPYLMYGDEGRGRRRENTSVFMLDFPFGVKTSCTAQTKKRSHDCSCCPRESSLKRFCGEDHTTVPIGNACYALHNYKEHSFLTRFVLFVLPCSTYKAFPTLIPFLLDLVCKDLKNLFFEGMPVEHGLIRPVCVGLKADIKYHGLVGNFSRWYTRMGRVRDAGNCHECLAGQTGMPTEDISEAPSWQESIFSQRPWLSEPVLTQLPFDASQPEKLHRRDCFHTLKMGIFRHLAASVLALCLLWGYLDQDDAPEGNSIPIRIQRGHGHFRLWCATFAKSPALRSFSKALMSWPNLYTSPWFNVKGSDVMLILRWLDDFVGQLLLSPQEPSHVPVMTVMRMALKAARDTYDILVSHRLLLERHCAVQLYEHMCTMLNGYAWMARWSLDNNFTLFAMVYKIHAWKHEALEMFMALKNKKAQYFLSPAIHSCEINEDVIGRISRLSRLVDSRSMQRRCLQLFLVKCRFLHKRAFQRNQA